MLKKIFNKVPKSLYTIASLSALAAINYSILNNVLVFLFIFVLFVHEFGHYFTAKLLGAKPSLPIFLPLPFIAIAFTKITGLNAKLKKKISFAGPLYAVTFSILLLLLNIILSFTSNFSLIFLIFGEIVFNYFGIDGVKYRQANKEILLCTS